jgi:peptide deformylase
MAILKIARMGHPVLKQRAHEVADPTAPAIRRLVGDMLETMRDAAGAGLAAPQVHVPLRVVIFHVPAARAAAEAGQGADEASAARGLTVLVNPVIEPLTEETADGLEGCLSVPGLRGMVPRFARIRYRGLTPEGETIDRIAAGFHARVVQHECDHLDGVLYPQRMTDLGTLMFTTELKHWIEGGPDEADEAEEA